MCVCVCVLVQVCVIVTSTGGGGGPPSSYASSLSPRPAQIRSTEADTLPAAANFFFPFHPSISPYVSTLSCDHFLPLYFTDVLPLSVFHSLTHINKCKALHSDSKYRQRHKRNVVFHAVCSGTSHLTMLPFCNHALELKYPPQSHTCNTIWCWRIRSLNPTEYVKKSVLIWRSFTEKSGPCRAVKQCFHIITSSHHAAV